MEYKVGDRVRVRKDLGEKEYDGVYTNYIMVKKAGEIVTIENVFNANRYSIKEDEFIWTEKMFDGFVKKPTREELLSMPVGTKIKTVTEDGDKYIYIKLENNVFGSVGDSDDIFGEDDITKRLIVNFNWKDEDEKIIEIQEPTYSTYWKEENDTKREMTIAEIEKELGYEIKVVKESNEDE